MSCKHKNNRLKRPTDPEERQRYDELVEAGRKVRKTATRAYLREQKLHRQVSEEFGQCMCRNWNQDIWR